MREALFWEAADGGSLACLLCPRACVLEDGQCGFCRSRGNEGGKMALAAYGRVSSLAVDPIEKKPLNHFLPASRVLSFGTVGCNMGCRHCQNWQISRDSGRALAHDIIAPARMAALAREQGCRCVAFTYNEPIVFAEYAIDTAAECRRLGLKTVAVTAGYINPEPRRAFFAAMDAANVDLKAFSDDFYRRMCGTQLKPVLDTLSYIKKETGVWLEVTNLVIPGENDSADEIRAMCGWIAKELGPDVPLHFSAYHPAGGLTRPATPAAALSGARRIAKEEGLRYVYTGNTRDPEGESTYCPDCGKLLIARDWFRVGEVNVRDGVCAFCGAKVAGVFG